MITSSEILLRSIKLALKEITDEIAKYDTYENKKIIPEDVFKIKKHLISSYWTIRHYLDAASDTVVILNTKKRVYMFGKNAVEIFVKRANKNIIIQLLINNTVVNLDISKDFEKDTIKQLLVD